MAGNSWLEEPVKLLILLRCGTLANETLLTWVECGTLAQQHKKSFG